MANAFDIDKVLKNGVDQNVDTHLLNETFHVFSKSPASNGTTLGGARLKSGHTTTASDVWADEIPAFFSAANQAKFDLFSTLAVKDDLCIFGGKVYQHNGTQFVSLGTEAEVLVDGATFQKNNKDVIKYHKNRAAINLTADNNNGDGSNNLSAKIYDAATGSTNFVSQFISSTDKMVAGVPSLAYDATVIADGVKLAEGLTNDNDYICNAYAGVIQFNKARSSGVTVSAWEYIGDKLTTSISGLRQSIKDISDVTLKGVVASVTADANTAQKAGITVDNTVSTTPVIKLTTGSVATGETKLVTGDAVKTYVDTTALADGGSIAQKISSAITELGDVAVKSDIAINDIKVKVGSGTATSLTPVNKSVTIEIPDAPEAVVTAEGTVTTDGFTKTTAVTSLANAAISNATAIVGADGSVTEANDGLVKASDAVKIAAKAAAGVDVGVTGITINGGTKQTGDVAISAVTGVIDAGASAGSLPSGGNEHGVTLNLLNNKAYVVVSTATYDPTSKTFKNEFTSTNYLTTAADVTAYVTDAIADAVDAIVFPDIEVSNTARLYGLSVGTHSDTTSYHYIHLATAAYSDAEAKWSDQKYLVTGSTVETFVNAETAKTLAAAKAYSNSLHTTSVTYYVTDTLPTVPAGKEEEYKGRIYLVLVGLDGVQAASGDRIEYMYVQENGVWGWEQIGTTTAELSGYASSVTINGQTYNVTANAVNLGTGFVNKIAAGQATRNANQSSVYGNIANDGTLTLGVASATDSVMGVSKMFSGDLRPDVASTVTDTAVSVKTASAMYSALADNIEAKPDADEVVSSINGVKGDIKLCVHNYPDQYTSDNSEGTSESSATTDSNLWGMGVVSGTYNHDTHSSINIIDSFVGLSHSYLTTANLPSDAVSVENNFVYNGSGDVITTIRPERMVSGFRADSASGLKSFVGDLSNLETSSYGSNHDNKTFYNSSALTTFIGDLSSLTDGNCMFHVCHNLTTFISDLSSLTNGSGMFAYCKLNAESLDCIADTINDVRSLTTSAQVTKKIDIGYNCSAVDAAAAKAEIEAKGWTCTMTYNA